MKGSVVLLLTIIGIGCMAGVWLAFADAETVYVKYRGPVDLSPFECDWIVRSAVVKRLCYDRSEKYVIVKLRGTYYHYCEVPSDVVVAWKSAESKGRFYNAYVKGHFDCRILHVPAYKN